MPMTVAPSSSRHAAARRWSAASGSSAASSTPGAAPRAALGVLGRRQDPPGSGGQRLRGELPAVCVGAGSPTNSAPGPASRESIVTRSGPPSDGRREISRAPAARASRSGSRSSPLLALDPPGAGAPRSTSCATRRSSNGILQPPANSWPCSWPLPAITTTSPGSRPAIVSAIAARRSALCATSAPAPRQDLGDDRLRILGARVVRGDDHAIGQPPAISPISGRLPRSRSPPAPEHHVNPPVVRARAASRTFRSESGVCA